MTQKSVASVGAGPAGLAQLRAVQSAATKGETHSEVYKGMVRVHNPKVFHLSMQDQWVTFNMFDAQAW